MTLNLMMLGLEKKCLVDSYTLNNTGTLLVAGTSAQVSVPLNNNSGTVSVQTGTLIVSSGGEATAGQFVLADATNLTFVGSATTPYTLDTASSLTEAAAGAQGIVFFASNQTIINGSFNLYQIAIDGGQAIVNGSGICSQVLLSYGTLGGTGLVDVTGNFDWTGGSLTGGTVPGTLTIGAGATLFLFQGYLTASNYYITINVGANGYLFEQALVAFQGGVTFTNAGTFTAYDACTINGTSTDSFTNTGTFTCGGVDANVSIALNLPFTNNNTVNIQAGVLSVQSGVSTGAWNISNGGAFNVVGTSSSQVYTLNTGTTFTYPGGSGTPGLILINGSGSGGLSVQTNVSVNQLSLYGGTLSGSANVTVTGQMVWFGGSMTTAQAGTNPVSFGNITIAATGALFVLDTTVNGQDQIPVLARPLNITGKLGWVGGIGSISVGLGQTTPLTLVNTQTMIESMTLADIPESSSWNTAVPYGGYGDVFALARALNTVLTGDPNAAPTTVGGGWTFTSLSWGASISTLFQNLPAIERASVAVAYAALFNSPLSSAIATQPTSSVLGIQVSYREANTNAYLTGNATDQGKRPIPVTALTMIQMAGGLAVGIVQGAVGEIVNLATLAYCFATAPITTATQVYASIKELVKTATTGTIAQTASVLCPSLVQVCNLASQGQLVSYQGGVALGQMISQIVVNATINLVTGGTGGLLGAVFGVLKTGLKLAAQTTVALTQAALKLAAPVLSAAARVTGQLAIVTRATVSLVRNAGAAVGNALATNVGAPLKALLQRVTPRKQIGCFVAGTPLLTPTGSKRIEQFEPGDWVLSRDENNPEGKIEAKRVEDVFIREALILIIRVGRQEIRTTAEHPFWVCGKGWVNAGAVQAGDEFLSHDGHWLAVDAIEDLGRIEWVYNLKVADYHTYFVGALKPGMSVWSHNADKCHVRSIVERKLGDSPESRAINRKLKRELGLIRKPQHHVFPQEYETWFNQRGIDVHDFGPRSSFRSFSSQGISLDRSVGG
jgi:hypothetical protein